MRSSWTRSTHPDPHTYDPDSGMCSDDEELQSLVVAAAAETAPQTGEKESAAAAAAAGGANEKEGISNYLTPRQQQLLAAFIGALTVLVLFGSIEFLARRQQVCTAATGPPTPPADYSGIVQLAYRPTTEYKIILVAPPDTGSTITHNILTGLFEGRFAPSGYLHCKGGSCPDKQEIFWKKHTPIYMNQTIVTKTHSVDVDSLTLQFGDEFDRLFFIAKERKEKGMIVPACHDSGGGNHTVSSPSWTSNPILCLQYDDLLYDDEAGIRRAVRHVQERIRGAFPYFAHAELKEEETVHRMMDIARSNAGDPSIDPAVSLNGGGAFKEHTLGFGPNGNLLLPPPP